MISFREPLDYGQRAGRCAHINVTGKPIKLNNGSNGDVYTVRAPRLTALRRNNSANYQVFKDGEIMGSLAQASSALPTAPITFLRTGSAYSPATTTVAAEWVGASLTDGQMRSMYRALGECLYRLGVISYDELLSPLGAATWYNDPRAIMVDGEVVTGVITLDGSVVANIGAIGEVGRQRIVHQRRQRR